MITPPEIQQHDAKFKPAAWQDYTIAELGQFVHLLAKRSSMRTEPKKRAKDIEDARNYWRMMGAQLDALKSFNAASDSAAEAPPVPAVQP